MGPIEHANLIREVTVRYTGPRRRAPASIRDPEAVAAYLRRRIHDDAREHLVAIFLDGRHQPIADQIVSVGTATASLVHPREIFQPAIAVGACSLLLAHNHPSGDVQPSAEDRAVTERIAKAGAILGITLLDHLVWERGGAYASLRELQPELFDTKGV